MRSRPLVGARPFSLRFLPLDTVSLFPPQFSPLLRCPRISRYFSSQDRRSMIYRKISIVRGDPPMWTVDRVQPSFYFARTGRMARTSETTPSTHARIVADECANVYGQMKISMSRKLTNIIIIDVCSVRSVVQRGNRSLRVHSRRSFEWEISNERVITCSVLTFRVIRANDSSAASVQ